MDEIARLRSELLDEKSYRDGHMVELEAKINDIPNIVAALVEKEMKKNSSTVGREEKNVGGGETSIPVGREGVRTPVDRSLSSSKKDNKCVGRSARPSPSTEKISVDEEPTYLRKRKKAHEIPLSSLKKDRESFEKFKNSSGFVVGPFRVKVRFEEQDFKVMQYLFTESLLNG